MDRHIGMLEARVHERINVLRLISCKNQLIRVYDRMELDALKLRMGGVERVIVNGSCKQCY